MNTLIDLMYAVAGALSVLGIVLGVCVLLGMGQDDKRKEAGGR